MKGKKLILVLIIIIGIYKVAWSLESTFYLPKKSYSSKRQKTLIANLKELITYKYVLDLLVTKQKKALEHLLCAKNKIERKYWTLMVLKYESLKLYCLIESLDRILTIQNFLNSKERNKYKETIKYVQVLQKFIGEMPLSNTIQLETLEIVKKKACFQHQRDFHTKKLSFKIWSTLNKHYRIIKRDFSRLAKGKEAL